MSAPERIWAMAPHIGEYLADPPVSPTDHLYLTEYIRADAILSDPRVKALVDAFGEFNDAFSDLINDWSDPYEPTENYERGVASYFKRAYEKSCAARAALAALQEAKDEDQ